MPLAKPKMWSVEVCDWLRSKYCYDSLTGDIERVDGLAIKLHVASNGYLQLRVTNARLGVRGYIAAHRLAWFFHHGTFPALEIDHIDHVKTNNAIVNLRLASRANNHRNGTKKVRRSGGTFTSKYRGVSWSKKDGRWVAMIGIDGRTRFLGGFVSEEGAADAYDKAAAVHFGVFANLNRTDVP